MLTAIREGSKGWISAIVIGLIVLTFALFGISSYLEGGSETPVATVNGEEISTYNYQNELSQQRQALTSRLGSDFDPALLETLGIRDTVLNNLIESRLVDQYTVENNFRFSDDQLVNRIQSNTLFHTEGSFDPELYNNVLASNRLSPQSYEVIERQNGINAQLQQGIASSAFTLDNEVAQLIRLENQSRDARYTVIPASSFVDEIEVTEADAKTHYDNNIALYQREARVKVEYIDLSIEKLMAGFEPGEDDIAQTFERLKGRFKTAEVRRASHILLGLNADDNEEQKASRLAEAEELVKKAQDGADFSVLAADYSEDPGSAKNGGDLGIITSGQMVKPFEDAVFSMKQDEIRGPVETQFGFHIIKLTELVEERVKTLEEAREEVIVESKRANAEATFSELVEPLQNIIFEQPDSLAPAADETGLAVETSEWFTLSEGQGVAEEPAVRRAAFAEDVLQDGLNSQAIELGFERMVALRKLDYEPVRPRPFEEVHEDIIATLKLEASTARVAELAKSSIENLTHLASWDIMLAQNEWNSETLPASRNDIGAELAILAEQVFAQAPSADDKPVFGEVLLGNGDVALYALVSVNPGDVEGDEAVDVKRGVERRLASRDGAELFRGFLRHIRANAEVVINEEQL